MKSLLVWLKTNEVRPFFYWHLQFYKYSLISKSNIYLSWFIFFGCFLTDEKILFIISYGWDNDTWNYYVFLCFLLFCWYVVYRHILFQCQNINKKVLKALIFLAFWTFKNNKNCSFYSNIWGWQKLKETHWFCYIR